MNARQRQSFPKLFFALFTMKLFRPTTISAALLAPLVFGSPSFAQPACAPGNLAQYLAYNGLGGCREGDKIFSDFSFPGFHGSSTFSVTSLGAQHTFSAAGLNFGAGTSVSYGYKVQIVAPVNFGFLSYRTAASSSEQTNPLVSTKSLTGTPQGGVSTAVDLALGNVITYSPAIGGPVAFTGNINVTAGRMDVFTDSIAQEPLKPTSTTPGPLPILGAAAAFGSVRKLRKLSSALKQG
jgi:hypothetical protein